MNGLLLSSMLLLSSVPNRVIVLPPGVRPPEQLGEHLRTTTNSSENDNAIIRLTIETYKKDLYIQLFY